MTYRQLSHVHRERVNPGDKRVWTKKYAAIAIDRGMWIHIESKDAGLDARAGVRTAKGQHHVRPFRDTAL
jgi:hypothetical protein